MVDGRLDRFPLNPVCSNIISCSAFLWYVLSTKNADKRRMYPWAYTLYTGLCRFSIDVITCGYRLCIKKVYCCSHTQKRQCE